MASLDRDTVSACVVVASGDEASEFHELVFEDVFKIPAETEDRASLKTGLFLSDEDSVDKGWYIGELWLTVKESKVFKSNGVSD